jgi:SPP1 gp7 family putative phage head morphogenesis protein
MQSITDLQRELFRDVTDREAVAMTRVLNAYRAALFAAQERWEVVARELERRIASGNTAIVALQLEQLRLQQFVAELQEILTTSARIGTEETVLLRQRLAEFGENHAALLLENGALAANVDVQLNRVSLPALQALVATLDQRSPVTQLFNSLAVDGAQRIGDLLQQGIILGENPRDIGQRIADAVDLDAQRALTIARTESLRAYRAASTANYQANAQYLSGWRWLSALDQRTCASCWAMHGTIHPLDEPFGSHVSCRCSPGPVVIGDDRQVKTGEQKFANLSSDQQREILGKKGLRIYESGTPLSAWVHTTNDPRWGLHRRAKTPTA